VLNNITLREKDSLSGEQTYRKKSESQSLTVKYKTDTLKGRLGYTQKQQ
jgi:hypothetical protein